MIPIYHTTESGKNQKPKAKASLQRKDQTISTGSVCVSADELEGRGGSVTAMYSGTCLFCVPNMTVCIVVGSVADPDPRFSITDPGSKSSWILISIKKFKHF